VSKREGRTVPFIPKRGGALCGGELFVDKQGEEEKQLNIGRGGGRGGDRSIFQRENNNGGKRNIVKGRDISAQRRRALPIFSFSKGKEL